MALAEGVRGRRVVLTALALSLALAAALSAFIFRSPGGTVPHARYYRAVYVLQRMDPSAALEPANIPAQVIRTDDTESLLHHPDKLFVLRELAADLSSFAGVMPDAPLFEAYARRALGEPREAAGLLSRYVFETPYQARHYELLCEMLLESADYASLLLICGEWRERDPVCLPRRAVYAWAARYGLGRYAEAAQAIQNAISCIGWEGKVYAARALAADGREDAAKALLGEVRRDFPDQQEAALRLWSRLELQPLRL